MNLFHRLFHQFCGVWPFERGRDFFMRRTVHGSFGRYLAEFGPWTTTRDGWPIRTNMGHDYAAQMLKMFRELEPTTKRFLLRHMPVDGLFLDVGANVGYFSLLLAHSMPNGRVIALEPNPPIAALLEESIARNQLGDRITLHRVAAADTAGTLQFGVDPANTGHSRLANEHHAGSISVETVVLDEWLPPLLDGRRLSLVKIDVEGAECRVLRGMSRLIAEHRPAIVVEGYDEHLREFGDSLADLRAMLVHADYEEVLPSDGNLYVLPRPK
jgi:FkbM family methyltransferase